MVIRYGFSEKKINYIKVKGLSGYYSVRECKGEHDPLFVKTHTFFDESNHHYLFFISLDVIGIDSTLRYKVKKIIKENVLTDSHKFDLFLFATHTHSGPSGMINTNKKIKSGLTGIFGDYDSYMEEHLILLITESIVLSKYKMKTFNYSISKTNIHKVATNRHQPSKKIDQIMTVFEIITDTSKTAIVNYSCHPTVLSSSNYLISADFLSGFYEKMNESFDLVSFINGSSANISTRFTREKQSFSQSRFFSNSLYGQFIREKEYLKEKETLERISFVEKSIRLKTKDVSNISKREEQISIEELKWKLKEENSVEESRLIEVEIEGKRATIKMKDTLNDISSIKVPFWIGLLDSQLIVFIPGEITSNLTEKLRSKYQALIFSLTNDYLFYFAEKDLYKTDMYEAQSSFFKVGEAEKLINKIEEHIKSFTCYNMLC
ncbi:neutral/alkaline non-lysosomal ceramidase N-terminal domain-containing protein [Oceanobacillus oncorhynchi]|uniref:neutral/alkaline non-lysosomal ceramidase N-terminal domain-containing protein n=1 Tax=Oceanobacillus oncorhynchi TaxID=545501 RepID=UPI002115F860|nr:neutral/alkaline non-lysosomal ceramidase N-terminal domain-containing protein [Oceanobacillus oncorhynchi]UUI38031.1 neutral/alkaline non-lysosomal ceramidase N-terminal domain-containing protein [Oceanobacillus oncorhynchi]